ncbi:hypothetical protein ABC347_05575 [Sphingomonas sp. 1P06PA]|uniref:hypothetical protein n=1 Tax=Sphingomonas sp. 1P06PA TaxID=554121 RepID=UPI0039A62113
MLGIALPALSLLAVESTAANEQRYDASMKCAVSLVFADAFLKASGHGPSQMGAMAQTYLRSARNEGSTLGKGPDKVQSEFLAGMSDLRRHVQNPDKAAQKLKLRETLDQVNSCATRLIGDGDKK